MSGAWDFAKGAAGYVFGDGDSAGLAGTGQQRFTPYNIDQSAYNDAYANRQKEAADRLAQIDQRQAPTMNAAQIGVMAQGQSAQIAPTSTVNGQNLGAAAQFGGAQLGSAAQMNAANINRQDLEGRGAQSRLMGNLEAQANGEGPSLATRQMQDAQDRNAKQAMSLTASMKGGTSSALAQRNALNAVSGANQQAARDAGSLRIQEQLQAQNALAGVAASQRAQDIGVNTSQADLRQNAAMQNMGALNNFQLQQAQFGQQAGLANMGAVNQRALDQGQMYQQANMFNAGAYNNQNLAQAQMYNQFTLANMNAQNERTMAQAQLYQNANQANLGAYMQNQGQNDQMAQGYFGAQMGMDRAQQEAAIRYQEDKAAQASGYAGLDQRSYEGAANRRSNFLKGAGEAATSMSDEREKTRTGKPSERELDEIYGSASNPKFNDSMDQIYGPDPIELPENPYGPMTLNESVPANPYGMAPEDEAKAKSTMGGVAGGAGGGIGGILGSVLGGGASPQADQNHNPYVMQGGGVNVGATWQAMNEPLRQKGGRAGWGSMGTNLDSISDEKEKAVLGGGAQATQNFLKQAAGGGSNNAWQSQQAKPMTATAATMQNNTYNSPSYSMGWGGGYGGGYGGGGSVYYGAPTQNYTNAYAYAAPVQNAGYNGSNSGGFAGSLSDAGMSTQGAPMKTWQPSQPQNSGQVAALGNSDFQMQPAQALSDENEKTEIRKFVEPLEAHSYRYRNPDLPGAGDGEYVSPMAQELEKSKLGRTMVKEDENGRKMVDYGKGFGTMLATMAMLNERQDELEKKLSKRKG